MNTLQEAIAGYQDNQAAHKARFDAFHAHVEETDYLKKHRDWVEVFHFGYGERAFHWFWKLLVDDLPRDFSFLEIGVFQAQTLSLVKLCALRAGKKADVVGVTPLNRSGDKYATHPEHDYLSRIEAIHWAAGVPMSRIIKGYSTDRGVQDYARAVGPFDAVYIDGCHDYPVVVGDIDVYGAMVKPGGYLVLDDAANDLCLPVGFFPGLMDVTRAMQDRLYKNPRFTHVLAVGHLRLFRAVA